MLGKFKRTYLRLVRRAYRYLRHPRVRKQIWLQALLKPVFDRELWHPCRDTVAGGMSIGLFCSQLPIPFQMLVASLAAVKARVNIPYAVMACWVTNPITQIPIFYFQAKVGHFLTSSLNLPQHPLFEKVQIPFLPGHINVASFIVGFLACGAVLGLLAYPVVYIFSAILPKLLPKTRYQRVKAKIIARKKTESQKISN